MAQILLTHVLSVYINLLFPAVCLTARREISVRKGEGKQGLHTTLKYMSRDVGLSRANRSLTQDLCPTHTST